MKNTTNESEIPANQSTSTNKRKRAKKEKALPKSNVIQFPSVFGVQKVKTETESFDMNGQSIREFTVPALIARDAFFTDEDVLVTVSHDSYVEHNEMVIFEIENYRVGRLLFSPNKGWQIKDLGKHGGDFYEVDAVKHVRKIISWKPQSKLKLNLKDTKPGTVTKMEAAR